MEKKPIKQGPHQPTAKSGEEEWEYHAQGRITGITVYQNTSFGISGLQFFDGVDYHQSDLFGLDGHFLSGSQKWVPGSVIPVKFGSGEYLTSISGFVGDTTARLTPCVVFLSFHTSYNKTYGPFGLLRATPLENFEFSTQEGRIISGFHGRMMKTGLGLSAIGIFEKVEAAKTKEAIAEPSGPDSSQVASTSGAKHVGDKGKGVAVDRPLYMKAPRSMGPVVVEDTTCLQRSIIVDIIANALCGDSAYQDQGVHVTIVNNIISDIPLHSHSVLKSMLEGKLSLGSPSEIEALHQATSSKQEHRILHHLCTMLCSSFYNCAKESYNLKAELDELRNEYNKLQEEKDTLLVEKTKAISQCDQADQRAKKAEEGNQLLMETFHEAKIDLAVRAVNRYKTSPAFDAFMHREFINGMKECKKSVEQYIPKVASQILESSIADMVEKGRQNFRENKKLWIHHCKFKELPILDMHLDLPDDNTNPRFYAHTKCDSVILLDGPEDEGPDVDDPAFNDYMSKNGDNVTEEKESELGKDHS